MNNGTINAITGGASADLTLPAPSTAGSLGANHGFIIDTIVPAAPISAPNLQDYSDTGHTHLDNITTFTTLTFDVECGQIGETVTLFVNGVSNATKVCEAAGTDSIFTTSLTDGDYDITYTLSDTANNQSEPSPELSVMINNTPAATPI